MSNRLDFISTSNGGNVTKLSRESGAEVSVDAEKTKEPGFAKASPNFKEVTKKPVKKTKAEEDDTLKQNEVTDSE